MARKTGKELEEIKKKYNLNRIWSWSRLNTYITDPYTYLLKYILKIPEDRTDSIYGVSGGVAHESVEKFYKGELDHQGMLEEYEDKLFEFNTLGFKYDRTDDDKNEKIAKKYEDCMRHFFLNHNKISNKPIIEPFILINIKGQYFQGYIDFLHTEKRDGKKKVVITDFKTSSIYKGKKLEDEARQLLLYAEGVHQNNNIPYEDIIIRFNFMKYVDVYYTQKKGDKKKRQVERNAIGKNLKTNAKMWLKHYGYSENEIEEYLDKMVEINGIECLPEEVQNTFKIDDCYIEIDFDENDIEKLKDYIINIIKKIVEKENEFEKTRDKNVFWKDVDNKSSYYHANLSGYSSNIHKPYAEYLKQLDLKNGIINSKNKNEDEDDLSWLDDIV